MVKSTCCSLGGLKFSSEHACWVAHKYLYCNPDKGNLMPSSGLHSEEVCKFLYSKISRRETRNGKHTRLFLPGNHTHFPRRRLRTDMVNTLVTSGPSIWPGNTNISRPLPWAYLFQSSKALSSYIPFIVYHEFASLIYRTYFHEDVTYESFNTTIS